jgi:hypothetical protein
MQIALFLNLMVGFLVGRSDNRSSAVRFKRVSACIPFSSGQLRGRRPPRCLANWDSLKVTIEIIELKSWTGSQHGI